MQELVKVNIGIPAFNEGFNIKNLILQTLEQEKSNYILDKIIVISDGSSDNTVSEAEKISDDRIIIINHEDRKGKAARFQELLQLSNSDILIQLDADIKLENKFVFQELVKAIIGGADLAFPKTAALTPRTYIEKVSSFGASAWERVLNQMDKEAVILHRCQGRCRAFSKKFYKNFILPPEADSVEDMYCFGFAVTHGYKAIYVPTAIVNYRLPATRKDFVKQARRFVKGPEALSQFFGKEFVKKYMPNDNMKLIAFFKNLFGFSPHISLGYVALQLYVRKTATMDSQKPIYDYVASTKNLD